MCFWGRVGGCVHTIVYMLRSEDHFNQSVFIFHIVWLRQGLFFVVLLKEMGSRFRISEFSPASALNLVAGVLTDEPQALWVQTLTLKQWVLTLLLQWMTLRELPSSPLWLVLEQNRKTSAYCYQVQEQCTEVETTRRLSTKLRWNMCLIMDLSVLR